MSKLVKEGHNGHFRICLNEDNAKKKMNSAISNLKKEAKNVKIRKNLQ